MNNSTRPCRFKISARQACRRSPINPMHKKHDDDCPVPPEKHHDYVPAVKRSGFKSQRSDPFVRTSMLFRRSDLTYLRVTYGSANGKLREWIAADRGFEGSVLRRHVPEPLRKPRNAAGKFSPKPAASADLVIFDDPVKPSNEKPDQDRVIEAFETIKTALGTDQKASIEAREVDDEEEIVLKGVHRQYGWVPGDQEVSDEERVAIIADMQERIEGPAPVGHVPSRFDDDDEDLVL